MADVKKRRVRKLACLICGQVLDDSRMAIQNHFASQHRGLYAESGYGMRMTVLRSLLIPED